MSLGCRNAQVVFCIAHKTRRCCRRLLKIAFEIENHLAVRITFPTPVESDLTADRSSHSRNTKSQILEMRMLESEHAMPIGSQLEPVG